MTDSQIDPRHFRNVLGHFPTGVTVVTGLDAAGAPHGITIGSFVSVSLDPPLVGFFPGIASKSWQAIAESGSFCVNILGAGQDELCWKFAKEPAAGETSKFAGVDWTPSLTGSPILPGIIGSIDCQVEAVHETGDHLFVIGRVHVMSHADDVDNAMVFFRGKVAAVDMPTA
jgi:flavin reductase (DIM6/NTAB) family NADH-FMN oxidoreductase RutF